MQQNNVTYVIVYRVYNVHHTKVQGSAIYNVHYSIQSAGVVCTLVVSGRKTASYIDF